MEEALDIPPMDLKASAELEVRKLQDMVKRLEKQNEILRHSQNGGQADIIALQKRNSVELEEVTLINLNDSSEDLEDSWLYESPVKPATPAQKSVNAIKWTRELSADGLDDVRGNLIDKLDDIETQQEISKVRVLPNPEGKISLVNTPKSSLFFQPTPKKFTLQRNGDTPGPVSQNIKSHELVYENNQLDSSAYGSMDEVEDIPQGPILRRSAFAKDGSPEFNVQQRTSLSHSENIDEETQGPILRRSALGKDSSTKYNIQQTLSQSEEIDEESQGPILRRSALSKSGPKSEVSKVSQSDDMDDEMQGPILRRSAVSKGSPQQPRAMFQPDVFDDAPQGPILRRSALPKDTKKSPSQLNGSPESQRQAVNPSPVSRMQPRSRRIQLTDNDIAERSNLDTSSQSSQDDLDDDINDKGPVLRRSALALPKPSSEGLSKQLWYSGPVNQMNKQKLKADSTAVRRSVSPSPDRRNKLQPRSPAAASGIAPRRSAGSRGSMEDLLDTDDSAPVQRRSLPQVPTETAGVKSRTTKSDEGIANRTQAKPKSKVQNLQQPQGNIIARRSKLATPNTSKENRGVVARRKAPSQTSNDSNLDDSWKEGCY